MKKFSYKTLAVHKQFISAHEAASSHDIEFYFPWVIEVANTFQRSYTAIGILDVNDLIQAGNEGLVKAWNRVDWERIDASPNPQGELWSFLKTRVKFSIRQEINVVSNVIKIPDRMIKDASKNMKTHEKILVNIFPSFFSEVLFDTPKSVEPYLSLQLEDLIVSYLDEVEHSHINKDMLLMFYGIGYERMTTRELSEKFLKKEGAISKIIGRTRDKLKTKEFKTIIENFFKN